MHYTIVNIIFTTKKWKMGWVKSSTNVADGHSQQQWYHSVINFNRILAKDRKMYTSIHVNSLLHTTFYNITCSLVDTTIRPIATPFQTVIWYLYSQVCAMYHPGQYFRYSSRQCLTEMFSNLHWRQLQHSKL